MNRSSILDVFDEAWGDKPSRVISAGRTLSRYDLDDLLEVWRREPEQISRNTTKPNEIWPLISHHTYGSRTLFSPDAEGSILPRVLTILLAHDGIVAADPIADIDLLVSQGKSDEALARMPDILEGIAKTEALIENDILRFSQYRPKLSDKTRFTLLQFFGLDPSLKVFTNFLEAAVTVQEIPAAFEREYKPQVEELFGRFGQPSPLARNLGEAVSCVKDLSAAVLEVTWQMAVCAKESICDLALSGPIEVALAESLFQAGSAVGPTDVWSRGLGRTRHMERMAVGDMPNFSAGLLSVNDAVAIRRGDAYEEFRQYFRKALDSLDDQLRVGQPLYAARDRFEETMMEASVSLSSTVRRASLKELLLQTSIPTAIGVVGAFSFPSQAPTITAGTGVATAAASVISQWIGARSTPRDIKIARRYASILGGDMASN